MKKKEYAIELLTELFTKSTIKSLKTMTSLDITTSKTVQIIPKVGIKPDIGCFIQFSGDYNGLVVMNFSADAAMELYRNYMLSMGMPEDELVSNFTSQEVSDCIGEIVNQLIGQAMHRVETKYELNAFFAQPKVLSLTQAITLSIDSDFSDNRRIVFKINECKFYMEISMERSEFIID